MSRKLATILAADVAQYSKHVEDNETAALSHLRELRALMDPAIAGHGGHIANTAGDSVIAIFDSAVEAVLAAIQIQDEHRRYNEAQPVAERLRYRIGINIGDVALQPDGDVLGGGVNIAARLESIAQPGGICVSENVFEQVDRKLPTELRKIGEHYVKNLSKPIRVYTVSSEHEGRLNAVRRMAISVLRKPLVPLASGATAVVLSLATLFLFLNRTPAWVQRSSHQEGSLVGEPEAEILSRFDLVTEGRFKDSRYLVIRTWGGSIEGVRDIARALGGHLVSISSDEENRFVFDLSMRQKGYWMVQNTDVGPQSSGPMIGLHQEPDSAEPDKGWVWDDGEPVSFLAWGQGQPGNSGGHQDLAQFRASGETARPTWDDIGAVQDSVVIEIPTAPR
ncbi:adenylate cyclase family 3 protein [Rhizobium sp. N113]|uniref:adenylate/guanylate cyclase domain-containing protein n=1 Tax=unclassified Rhizobium TaxID=2613769 RepID=UPI0007EB059A|nr:MULTISPECIES: adenylate/guanylate cyclase domain-containing protein [unclassified Rhizobium]ANL10283.1 adenylate cyclase family 3 protein [Rhizobium sp. N1341]ANL22335.1 adenylate cyclase family 3 protein [Rhizobium sp. N113]ANM41125.1 adenylate cyclase family 3 protein [Rhizobium sp. N741]